MNLLVQKDDYNNKELGLNPVYILKTRFRKYQKTNIK